MKEFFYICGYINNEKPSTLRWCETLAEAEKYAEQILTGHWLIPGNSSRIWINSEKAGRLATVCDMTKDGTQATQIKRY